VILRAATRWIYLLPALHLLLCIITVAADLHWEYVVMSDLPFSPLLMAVLWNFESAWVWFAAFAVIGTLWWYLLSYWVYSLGAWALKKRRAL
jgi:hypothetical protein